MSSTLTYLTYISISVAIRMMLNHKNQKRSGEIAVVTTYSKLKEK
jgi:hypothetical protein